MRHAILKFNFTTAATTVQQVLLLLTDHRAEALSRTGPWHPIETAVQQVFMSMSITLTDHCTVALKEWHRNPLLEPQFNNKYFCLLQITVPKLRMDPRPFVGTTQVAVPKR